MDINGRATSLRWAGLLASVGVMVGLSAQSALALPPGATFSYKGAEQFYTIPPGVTTVEVEAAGGDGGIGINNEGSHSGPGLELDLALPVTPGQVLYAEVGAPGNSSFGGGGAGGGGSGGGDGGGASDVRTCSVLAASCPGGGSSSVSRLMVAGGGGGLGGSPPTVDIGSPCGTNETGGSAWDASTPIAIAGGTLLPGQNDAIGNTSGGSVPAEGGTPTGPGIGGVIAGCTGGAPSRTYAGAVSGASGSGASGGSGGTGAGSGGGGGGGGGGYFGGGGGPSGQQETAGPCPTCVSDGSGGAGGASFYTSQATGRIFYTNNYLTGETPSIVITPLIEIDSPTGGAQYTQGQVVNASYSCAECSGGPGLGGTVPSGSPIDTSTVGPHTFTVSDISHSGASPAVSTVSYTVIPAPTVSGISPTSGSEAGGTEVAISGTGFVAGATVHFGSSPATSVTVNSAESITAITPSGSGSGRVDVTVTTSSGTSEANPLYHFKWLHIPPKLLGGMNVAGYCESLGDHGDGGGSVTYLRGEVEGLEGSEYAYKNWACIEGNGTPVEITPTGPAPSMENLCAVQYPGAASYADPSDPDNAFTWACYESPPPEGNKGGGGGGGGGSGPTAKAASLVTPIVSLPPLLVPPPVLARTGNVAPVSGKVLVRVPGTSKFVALSSLQQIPFGSVIDAIAGTVSVTTALPGGGTQTGQFFEGEFILRQGPNGVVVAELTGGDFSVCPTARERSHIARSGTVLAQAAASRSHVVRKLWANAHGKFSTKGNYAAGAVQGTEWLTEDLCNGTLIKVTRDKVAVTNLVNHRHVKVTTGHHYLAKAP
jgi:IPT/TIG domain